MSAPTLPAALRLGPVHLTVTRLERSLDFYTSVLGLQVHRRDDATAGLGTGGEDVLVLFEQTDARPPGRHAGIFHYCLLYPSRDELARAAARLAATRTAIQGASDHLTHEAVYLADPDGIGIELAADRPRERWPDFSVVYRGGPQPLDLDGLRDLVAGEEPAPRVAGDLRIGHVHLHGADLAEAVGFYRDVVGFDLIADWNQQAVFLSAGGYHHHVAVNVWRGQGIPPQPDGVVGLRHWSAVLPSAADVEEVADRARAGGAAVETGDGAATVRDPGGLALRLTAA